MRLTLLAASFLAFVSPTFAQSETTLSYDNTYDDASLPLNVLACSNGPNGLESKGYATLGSLPSFPNVGGTPTVTGWNSPECGSCYAVTYGTQTVYILAVDKSLEGINASEEAMNTLTDGQAEDLGRVPVGYTQVDASLCGL